MRLDRFLVAVGVGSRKEVKVLIKKKRVRVNDQVASCSDQQVDEGHDHVYLDEKLLKYQHYTYIMLHKPQGVISATEDAKEKTVLDLLDKSYHSLFPVGRLDKNTEGLLLLTNDGQLAHQLLSPKKHVDKTYFARLKKELKQQDIQLFKAGIILDDGYHCMPAKLAIVEHEPNAAYVTIQEGKFHQIKRMFEAIGNKVTYLRRESMGILQLDDQLPLGQYRELTVLELTELKNSLQWK